MRRSSVCSALLAGSLLVACVTPKPTRVAELSLASRVEHIDLIAREPMVVEHPDGTLFVAGYGSSFPTLWKSRDHGTTWTRVEVGQTVGNSDVDLTIAPDGTLYFASMLYDRQANEGRQIAIGASRDGGATWNWTTVSQNRFDDRPWVEVAPDGTAHAIWNDGSGVSHIVSRDRGVTWTQPARVHDKGGSSHLAIGPKGEVAVRITPLSASGNKYDEGVELIAVSTDAGATWSKHAAPGERDWSADFEGSTTPRWVEPLAWDVSGRLYSFWGDVRGISLARSSDRGATWTTWRVLDMPQQSFFPYVAARRGGELAVTWFTSSTNEMLDLQWHVARIDATGDGQPSLVLAPPQKIEALDQKGVNTPAGEYLPVVFLREGSIVVVTPIQNAAAKRFGFAYWTFELR